MLPHMMNRDFLTLQNYSADEIWDILELTKKIKIDSGGYLGRLLGKSVLLLFQKPSTRTRVSFEVAIRELGGNSVCLGWAESQLGRETIADTARVLSRYVQCVVARVYQHTDLEDLAQNADIPVVNALSNLFHPCQIVGDLFTIWEHFDFLEDLNLAYIGDANNVCNSLLIGCSKMGLNITIASPPKYPPREEITKIARENAKESRSSIKVTAEPIKAVKDANIVYTDVFVSMGFEEEHSERMKLFLPDYQVTDRLFKHASSNAVFMHCLPAHRGEEVTDEVMDGPRSIVWDQAENRLHSAKSILASVI
ncbi:MAG: ornithine carbamoyltransferase [Candidatus Bathyarchaeia archaeon]